MILITGASGNVGSELIAALLPAQAGHIRVLTRNPGAVFLAGTQKVVADLADTDLALVLDGVHAVFLLTDGLNIAAHDHRHIAAAQQAGVERIVKLSVRSVGHDATDPITTMYGAGEQAIRDSGIGWTFLGPTAFMSNALNWPKREQCARRRPRPTGHRARAATVPVLRASPRGHVYQPYAPSPEAVGRVALHVPLSEPAASRTLRGGMSTRTVA